jgi:Na+/H+-dicarboxylate symporter
VKLHTRILIGMVAGGLLGWAAKLPAASFLQHLVTTLEPLGTIFIKLITMVVVPLVVASLFVGIASLGDVGKLGRMGGRTLAYFLLTTLAAATTGAVVAHLAGVGRGLEGARAQLPAAEAGTLATPAASLEQLLVNMVPQNPIAAAAQTDLLPLIVAVCLFGAAAAATSGPRRSAVVHWFEGVNELCGVLIGWLMRLAPAGVFVLAAAAVARASLDLIHGLAIYAVTVLAALATHVVTLLLVLVFVARRRLGEFLRSVSDALLLAFSTASSNATLPVSMAAARDRLGLPNEVVSFVLPLGASLNKNGAAAYKAVTAVFVAGLYGVHLGVGGTITVVLASTAAAFAGTGVPGSSLVTTLIVLNAIGLGSGASAAVALVAGIDRPLDMCRTSVNTVGNLVGAAVIGRMSD